MGRMLACKSALDCAGGGEGREEVAAAGFDRAVPRTAADAEDLVLGNDFGTAVDLDAFAAAADEDGWQAAVFDAGDFFTIPAVVFGLIFADEGLPPLRAPKLLLPLLLLLLLPTLLRELLRLLLVLQARGVFCRGLPLLPTRRAVDAPLHTTIHIKHGNSVANETGGRVHLQMLSRALLRRTEEEEEEEGVADLTLQAAAPSSRRLTGPTSISAVQTSLYCTSSSLHIFSCPSCA
jgi:hypothetical protein